MTSGIYKIVSPTGKLYIGQSIDIEQRFYFYKRGKNYKNQPRLRHSIEKYGIETHLFEVVEVCAEEDLNTRERYYQDFYNVIGPDGLNCRLQEGDGKTGKNSIESNRKRSETMKGKNKGRPRPDVSERNKIIHKGKTISEKQKQQIREKLKGKTFSDERNQKIAKALTGKPKSKQHKKNLQKPKSRIECPYCKKEGSISNMKRWHFNNCKNYKE